MQDVIVIGAGVIGISAALALQADGCKVTVLDRQDSSPRASDMNAGAFAFADIMPLAAPGIMRKAPKWLLDPLGPLSVPPAYAFKILPWLVRFWRSSLPDRYRKSLAAQASLMTLSQEALETMIRDTSADELIRRDGQLQLYESEQEFQASLPDWELRRKHGVNFTLLKSAEEIADIQPGIDSRFSFAGFTPDWINTCDPAAWLSHLTNVFRARDGDIIKANATQLRSTGNGVEIRTANGTHCASHVIVAAGAWSHHLAKTLGHTIPLETERGYNTTLPATDFDLKTHLTFPGHGFVVTRINDGIRVGGAVELGGLNLPANYKRAEILLEKARSFLPGLDSKTGKQWMGFRPSLPDSLPVIGHSSKDKRVIYAFGHGHLGLTQSAGTAELVRAFVAGTEFPIDPAVYSPNRF
ncbi:MULTISPECIES: FAD-binding oxidoreductase [unclassified Roseibium]|uniref:NAD(P)/FAD-dependent oxidoreductase n=1 Tax=unclassified Roseibium TaxID=2629323 RepID=UPI00092708A6|nr:MULTISPECIES: FAD-dependent oxidoreductase [unclassified Roseibium]OJJ10644.1 amino acid dehydrogenase [Alphaproteobacteria bacterium AO1-B]